jgi:ATP-dependent Lhr-like helicase
LSSVLRGDEPLGVPDVGAVAEVIEALGDSGALFAGELVTRTRRMPTEVEDALWDAVARGLVTSDGFAAIRALSRGRRREHRPRAGVSRLRRGTRQQGRAAGRWSLLQSADYEAGGEQAAGRQATLEAQELAEAWADQLLVRWGVVFYDIAAHEGAALRWREIQWALRRMEDRGLVRGGRFVNGFSGEQFALPAAVTGLKQIRRSEPDGRTLKLNAADPLNVTGVILPGDRVPSRRTETVELAL